MDLESCKGTCAMAVSGNRTTSDGGLVLGFTWDERCLGELPNSHERQVLECGTGSDSLIAIQRLSNCELHLVVLNHR